jgi:hypothetical protein
MSHNVRRLVAGAVAAVGLLGAALVVSGCASNGELRAEVAESLQQYLPVDETQADCVAGELIGLYGEGEMRNYLNDPVGYVPDVEVDERERAGVLERCEVSVFELIEAGPDVVGGLPGGDASANGPGDPAG